jgi:hypothetical protein
MSVGIVDILDLLIFLRVSLKGYAPVQRGVTLLSLFFKSFLECWFARDWEWSFASFEVDQFCLINSFLMNQQIRNKGRTWKIICWNIRGVNSSSKWNSIHSKIQETGCDILCIQETKRDFFDATYIKKLMPPSFDSFEYVPSIGASGGILTVWKSSKFNGNITFQNRYALSIELASTVSGVSWILTNIYAPCTTDERNNFLS